MKSKNIFLLTILSLCISGCSITILDESKENDTPADSEDEELEHEHTFSDTYSYDNEYHWYAATCEHTDVVKNKLRHNFSEWTINSEATITSTGSKSRRCYTCGYVQEEVISKLPDNGLVISNPFTVDEAIEEMYKYDDGEVSEEQYYVAGVVSSAIYNSSYSSFTLFFENHESEDLYPFEVYSAILDNNYISGEYTAESLVGATVEVYGYLYKYQSRSGDIIYEISYLNSTTSPTGSAVSPLIVSISSEPVHTHAYSLSWSNDETYHWHAATCEHSNLYKDKAEHTFGDWVIDFEATTQSMGSRHRNCVECNYAQYEDIDKLEEQSDKHSGTFTLYSFNDFHGAVNEYASLSHVGLAKFGTYLKNNKDGNTMIVDSGDTFQGSLESNYNRGNMITDVFNYVGVDVHTIGNHDFDWGIDKLLANKNRKYGGENGFSTTYLGANIFDYDFENKIEGNTQQSQIAEPYYTKVLDNGIKVGVVGVIPKSQINDILSTQVEDICFKEHIEYVKSTAVTLRQDLGCDIVIASLHASSTEGIGYGLTDNDPTTGKRYVDYVCCAHTHQNQYSTENGVYFTQAACYGEMMYKSTFTVKDGEITNVDVTNLSYSTITSATKTIDSKISSIIADYSKEYESIGEEVIASSVNGTFYKGTEVPNLLCKAAYNTAQNQGYTPDVAIVNSARYNLTGYTWTYADIYEALPFDNSIYVIKVKGSKNMKEISSSYNSYYHDSTLTSVDDSTWYTVVVIDYLLFHVNSTRYYDYFDHSSSNMKILGTLKKNNEDYLYRDVFADYVKTLSGTISSTSYSSNDEFAKLTY